MQHVLSRILAKDLVMRRQLITPDVPTLAITAPTCTASGFATITNYDGTLTYDFTR